MFKYVAYVLKHTFDYKGRARRKEFWYFILFQFLFQMGVGFVYALLLMRNEEIAEAIESAAMSTDPYQMLSSLMGYLWPLLILSLLLFVPSLSVAVRRLHDTGKPGWWVAVYYGVALVAQLFSLLNPNSKIAIFLSFANSAVLVLMFVWLVSDSMDEENEYGPNPKEDEPIDVLE